MGFALTKLFTPSPLKQQAHALYVSVVAQARKPFLYEGYGIPDTLDGRFDAIVLHLFIVTQRLKRDEPSPPNHLVRMLQEAFIADMDRSMREMGVGDTGVGKRIKHMASALLGRMNSYEQAAGNNVQMAEALLRNVFREQAGAQKHVSRLALYVTASMNALAQQPTADIMNGDIHFVS